MITKFIKFINESNSDNIYYHGSFEKFNKFKNKKHHEVDVNDVSTLDIQGNFITPNRMLAICFSGAATPGYNQGNLYTVKLNTENIFDLRKKEHQDLYFEKTVPKWNNYNAIRFAKKNKFDGIFLYEDAYGKTVPSILVFNPNNLEIINREIVTDKNVNPNEI